MTADWKNLAASIDDGSVVRQIDADGCEISGRIDGPASIVDERMHLRVHWNHSGKTARVNDVDLPLTTRVGRRLGTSVLIGTTDQLLVISPPIAPQGS